MLSLTWSLASSATPVQVQDDGRWVLPLHPAELVFAGGQVCALDDAGAVRCFQARFTTEVAREATPVSLPPIETLASDASQACAIDLEHRVWCWSNGAPERVRSLDGTQALSWSTNFTRRFGCRVDVDGAVGCWGRLPGQTIASRPTELTPTSVAAGARSVSLGDRDGVIETEAGWVLFGEDRYAQSALDTTDAEQVVVGMHQACALRDGVVSCAGEHGPGALAVGGVTTLVGRDDQVCALADGVAWCWRDDPRDARALPVDDLVDLRLVGSGSLVVALTGSGDVRVIDRGRVTTLLTGVTRMWASDWMACGESTDGLTCARIERIW